MRKYFLILMIMLPILEIWALISVGNRIGAGATILLILLTGLLGIFMVRLEGLNAIRTAQLQLSEGRMPNKLLLDGICILIGGALLIPPGFITDTIGFLLLFPLTRNLFKRLFQKIFDKMIRSGNIIYYSNRK